MERTYTMLDVRLGYLKLTPEQERMIDQKVMPIMVRALRRYMMSSHERQTDVSSTAVGNHRDFDSHRSPVPER